MVRRNVTEGERKSHRWAGSNSDYDSYVDPTLQDYIRSDAKSHRQTPCLVIRITKTDDLSMYIYRLTDMVSNPPQYSN